VREGSQLQGDVRGEEDGVCSEEENQGTAGKILPVSRVVKDTAKLMAQPAEVHEDSTTVYVVYGCRGNSVVDVAAPLYSDTGDGVCEEVAVSS
jgi:hypothetical protein